jgi:hypothetical protein
MIGSQIGIYNGKVFNTVEIKVSRPTSARRNVADAHRSPRWSASTWANSPSHTSPSATVARVSERACSPSILFRF